ncbi:MAG TPA: hypothetical protein VGS41_00055, partial [Chthonomonadales bacterium]|nr:hypothetical protein [Chthonomonadales bacterium]
GILLRPNQAAELTDLYHQGVYRTVGAEQIAAILEDREAIAGHREAVLECIDADSIRARNYSVVVDCCNGAASRATPEFLEALGCNVIPLYTYPAAPFPHPPEPLPENLRDLCAAVGAAGADIGFAQDADADRLAVIDGSGTPLGEDCTVTLAANHYLKRSSTPLVVNISTSRMIDDIAAAYCVPVYRTRVGEIHVLEKMLELGALIGGEGNGGVICPSINPCRDSFVAMALLLEAMAQEGLSIAQLRGRIPAYHIVKEKLECPSRQVAPALKKLRDLFAGAQLENTDGLKASWPNRWLSARASNTEPVLRLTAEAPTAEEAELLMRDALECLSPSA